MPGNLAEQQNHNCPERQVRREKQSKDSNPLEQNANGCRDGSGSPGAELAGRPIAEETRDGNDSDGEDDLVVIHRCLYVPCDAVINHRGALLCNPHGEPQPALCGREFGRIIRRYCGLYNETGVRENAHGPSHVQRVRYQQNMSGATLMQSCSVQATAAK